MKPKLFKWRRRGAPQNSKVLDVRVKQNLLNVKGGSLNDAVGGFASLPDRLIPTFVACGGYSE
jgi:hypothetical protein